MYEFEIFVGQHSGWYYLFSKYFRKKKPEYFLSEFFDLPKRLSTDNSLRLLIRHLFMFFTHLFCKKKQWLYFSVRMSYQLKIKYFDDDIDSTDPFWWYFLQFPVFAEIVIAEIVSVDAVDFCFLTS